MVHASSKILYTWKSPDGNTKIKLIIDYILAGIAQRCSSCINESTARHTLDPTSTQITNLLVATMKIRLNKKTRRNPPKRLGIGKLCSEQGLE